jgi:hypothetical protein
MPDWPIYVPPIGCGVLSTAGRESVLTQHQLLMGAGMATAAAWPTANRALYMPVMVERQITVVKMAIVVGAQAGNVDVGIYDEIGNRLVSAGSTAVGAAGIQVFDTTDVTFGPGIFLLAMNVSTVTTATFLSGSPGSILGRTSGLRQQDVGAVALPTPTATFAAMGASYIPLLCAYYTNATV